MRPGTIDLLQSPVRNRGAGWAGDGIAVSAPWGSYSVGRHFIREGWYVLRLSGRDAALEVRLDDESRFAIAELQATEVAPAFVRLAAGQYEITVTPGVRPGLYLLDGARLERLTAAERGMLLMGRLVQALRQGVSLKRIAGLVKLALSRNATFGIRAQGGGAAVERGFLVQRDARFPGKRSPDVAPGVRFLVRGAGNVAAGLESQTYRNLTTEADDPHDFVIVVGHGDALLPDALALFAAAIQAQPDKALFLADKWLGNGVTAHVAWDPFLYGDDLPTPYAYAVALGQPSDAMIFGGQNLCAVLSVPVARAAVGPALPGYAETATPQAGREACSIVIPTRDRADLLEACLAGLFERTAWPHEVIIVDNGSVEIETQALFDAYAERGLKVVKADMPFNFSTLCNLGARAATHPYLLFLNNDVVLHRPDWLGEMMRLAVHRDVGAVGARLLYGDGRLQHGGVMLGLTQICGHLWRGLPREAQDEIPQLRVDSMRSAVTAACLCVDRKKFEAVGGFDEVAFPVTLNDVDLCLRLTVRGWHSVYAARAEAYHLEGESRGADLAGEKWARRVAELEAFAGRWGRDFQDPWMSEALSRSTEAGAFR